MFRRHPRYVVETPSRREAIWLCVGLFVLLAVWGILAVLDRSGVL